MSPADSSLESTEAPRTRVYQSRAPGPLPDWLAACLASVQQWSESRGFDYRLIGDELFAPLPPALINKTRQQKVIASDLGRLYLLEQGLADGFDQVIWLDADCLIFAPQAFSPLQAQESLGREIWVQSDADRQRLKVYRQVHNAYLAFRRGSSLLPFYREQAERLLRQHPGGMPAQFIGPKLLTALHNILQFPIQEDAGVMPPLVIRDLLAGGGPALRLWQQQSAAPCHAVNLCQSSLRQGLLEEKDMELLVGQLLELGGIPAA